MFEDVGLVRCGPVINAEHFMEEAMEHPVIFQDAFCHNPTLHGQFNSPVGIDHDVAVLLEGSEISSRYRRSILQPCRYLT